VQSASPLHTSTSVVSASDPARAALIFGHPDRHSRRVAAQACSHSRLLGLIAVAARRSHCPASALDPGYGRRQRVTLGLGPFGATSVDRLAVLVALLQKHAVDLGRSSLSHCGLRRCDA
jgi:hypothetical protein